MSHAACEKGNVFEDKVESILVEHNIKFIREKILHGFGKRWKVDFFLPKKKMVIECKNVIGRNLQRYLENDCLKFLDLRNKFLQMDFVIVIPKIHFTMGSFVRFCIAYNIKLATPLTLISSFDKSVKETNTIFGNANSLPKQMALLIKKAGSKGLTRKEVTEKIGNYNHNFFTEKRFKKYGIMESVFQPKIYFTEENYQKSNEKKFLTDLRENYLKYPDEYFSKKYNYSKNRIIKTRKKLGLKKIGFNIHRFPCDYCKNSEACFSVCNKFLEYSQTYITSPKVKAFLKDIQLRHPSQQKL